MENEIGAPQEPDSGLCLDGPLHVKGRISLDFNFDEPLSVNT